jgi:hypothetical protein
MILGGINKTCGNSWLGNGYSSNKALPLKSYRRRQSGCSTAVNAGRIRLPIPSPLGSIKARQAMPSRGRRGGVHEMHKQTGLGAKNNW